MTREEARAELEALNSSIATAVLLIRCKTEILDRFFVEWERMDSVGHILDPTLFRDPERRETVELLTPVYRAARDLVTVYDRQETALREALAKAGLIP